MRATVRLDDERRFHDEQARRRAAGFLAAGEALRFADGDWLDHETWVRPAVESLGPLAGLRVLDYGCGHGMAAVVLARRGARVTACDLSRGYAEEAARRAAANGVAVAVLQADCERLPFGDGAFDRVWGNAILHHLDVGAAAREVRRVLAPGGVAVFCEPWGGNPLLRWAREHLSYPEKERTPDERPLTRDHVRALRGVFGAVEVRGFQLASMLRRVLPVGRTVAALHACDGVLLRLAPALRHWCRYAVLTLRR